MPVLVVIHGTSRHSDRCIDVWRDFAIRHHCAIIAPLFPCLLSGPLDIDGYHYLGKRSERSASESSVLEAAVDVDPPLDSNHALDHEVRHDLVLLTMLDEVSTRWPTLDTSKVFMAGFSGGAQFAHRFMYLHPERLLAVGIGAPGNVTQLNFDKPWPGGLADASRLFGRQIDMAALKRLQIVAAVGREDRYSNTAKAIRLAAGDTNEIGKTRTQSLATSVEHWREFSLNDTFVILPGVAHEMER